jgi:putative ABC transport system permease protein
VLKAGAMTTLLLIAIRNLLRNRRRTAITLGAMLLGVTVSVVVRGLLNGIDEGMRDQAIQASSGAVQIHRAGYLENVLSTPLGLDMPAGEELLHQVRGVPGVAAAAPRLQFAGTLSVGEESVFLAVQGLDPVAEAAVCPLRAETLEPGSRFGDPAGVVLSRPLLEATAARPGTAAVFLAPDQDGALNGVEARVTGGLRGGGLESRTGLVPLALAQELLRMPGRATEIAVAVKDLRQAPEVAARLRQTLGERFEVHTWDQVLGGVKDAFARHDLVSRIIAVVFVVLMLLGISNTMLMSALERTREIGTMMAVGLRRSRVLRLILFEALVLGAMGSGAGGLLGALIIAWLAHRHIVVSSPVGLAFHFVPSVSAGYVVTLVAVVAVGAVLSSLYPAWRASRLRPVQALAGK